MLFKKYKYELHCHTATSSRCSRFEPKEIVDFYLSQGYDGIFITDHIHYRGDLNKYLEGYYEVKRLAKDTPLKVFFGLELSLNDAHFLVYGLSPEWHLNHPEIEKMGNRDALRLYRENGAIIIQAHPYRISRGIDRFELYPYYVDGVELYNGANKFKICPLTKKYAKLFNLPTTAGSDIHNLRSPYLCQFISSTPINDVYDYLKILKSKKYQLKLVKNPLSQDDKKRREK